MSANETADGENRKHRRFSVDVEATVTTNTGTSITARTRDVSQTGICLVGTDPVLKTDVLSISLVLSFTNNAKSEPLGLAGRVVWCTKIGDAYQIGAMFEEMTEEQENFLEMFLQFLDGTLKPRGSEQYPDPDEDIRPVSAEDKDNPFK